ncbi:MAG: HAD-IA family hydrolase [Bacteroidales bacterium]|nr:HAD-IA family hydrolase [Bacteroidales bacterium]
MKKFQGIKLLVLDFDGTLADTLQVILDSMQSTLRVLNLPARSDAQCKAMIGLRLTEIPEHLFPELPGLGPTYAATYREEFAKFNTAGAVPLFPNVMETLHALAEKGYMLSIASSRAHETLDKYLRDLQLGDIVTYVVAAEDVSHAKPDPEPVLKTLQHFALQPQEVLVVGDTDFDILMGRNADCYTCGVTYGNGSRASMLEAGAHVLIDDFSQLLDLL